MDINKQIKKYIAEKELYLQLNLIDSRRKVYLLNFSDDSFGRRDGKFRENQTRINNSIIKNNNSGITNIVSWREEDFLKSEFYKKNKNYLKKSRFENGAVWKPFIILDLLKKINEEDIILYHDCLPISINCSLIPLIDHCRKFGYFINKTGFEQSVWTKRDSFILMDCDSEKYYKSSHLQTTWFLIKKNSLNLDIVSEWLSYNLNPNIASYKDGQYCGKPNSKNYIENRGDQSIFSILCKKYNIGGIEGLDWESNRNINLFTKWFVNNNII